jgi:hypothetical protein
MHLAFCGLKRLKGRWTAARMPLQRREFISTQKRNSTALGLEKSGCYMR